MGREQLMSHACRDVLSMDIYASAHAAIANSKHLSAKEHIQLPLCHPIELFVHLVL